MPNPHHFLPKTLRWEIFISNFKKITIADIICEAQKEVLEKFPNSLLFGLGVNDPKRVFGTTRDLVELFGQHRVFETPTSEACTLGVALGLSISGFQPILVHQRLDFFLLAMDQLVNGAAKWRYMFGDNYNTSMIIRLIVGRGWGQGPTHSQNLHSWFAHIPNLRVYFPTFASDFFNIYRQTFLQPYPTLIIEDRWIHQNITETIKESYVLEPIKSRTVFFGKDLTLITFGYNTILSVSVVHFFKKIGIDIELLDLVTLKPLDFDSIYSSVKKTGRAVIVDSGFEIASISSYISDCLNRNLFGQLKAPVLTLSAGDFAEPTSFGVINEFKINSFKIAQTVAKTIEQSLNLDFSSLEEPLVDVPNIGFQGPF